MTDYDFDKHTNKYEGFSMNGLREFNLKDIYKKLETNNLEGKVPEQCFFGGSL